MPLLFAETPSSYMPLKENTENVDNSKPVAKVLLICANFFVLKVCFIRTFFLFYFRFNSLAPIEYLTARTALLYSTGEVLLVPAVRMKVPCQTSHDNVTCTMTIGSWAHDSFDVNPVIGDSEPVLSDMIPNQRWNLVDSSAELKCAFTTESEYASVTYTFNLQRRSKKCVE